MLIGLRRFDEARVNFRRIARCNGKKLRGWSKQDFMEAAVKEAEFKKHVKKFNRASLIQRDTEEEENV